jgi:hypothetical protein
MYSALYSGCRTFYLQIAISLSSRRLLPFSIAIDVTYQLFIMGSTTSSYCSMLSKIEKKINIWVTHHAAHG